MRTTLDAIRGEVEAAAKQCGFDVSRKNWLKRLIDESKSYPFTQEEGECCATLLPPRIFARIRALELIEALMEVTAMSDVDADGIDEDLLELRTLVAADPISVPVAAYIKQTDRKAA
jgi:hypothetical protein